MATKKIAVCSLLIIGVWGYLHMQSDAEIETSMVFDVFEKIGIETLTSEEAQNHLAKLKEIIEIPDIVQRKTEALVQSYASLNQSQKKMFESIEQMKAAANAFQEGKDQMLNEFKDLPTDLLEANSFKSIEPLSSETIEDADNEEIRETDEKNQSHT